jgi:hypothetical protein
MPAPSPLEYLRKD